MKLLTIIWLVFFLLVSAEPSASLAPQGADTPLFLVQRLDGPVAWYGPFSEGSAVFDVNRDGVLDITAGPYWYPGPDFPRLPLRDCPTRGVEFVNNLGEFPYDFNGDGWTDLLSASWFENGIFWYENTGSKGGLWPRHKIIDSEATEALIFADLNGDQIPDILPNHYRPQEVFWIEVLPGPRFRRHLVGTEGSRHGIGLGDLNGDSRPDIITMDGWYEAGPDSTTWTWHPEWNNPGSGGIGMLSFDVNRDGRQDVIYGLGHDYGLYWLEQPVERGTSWTRHVIEENWSQAHTLVLYDMNQDGRLDLVTGKRLRGHAGADPGALEPAGIYWYDISRDGFSKHILSYNSPAGTGMNINFADLDSDQDIDLVLSGKSGLYLLENMSNFKDDTYTIIQRY